MKTKRLEDYKWTTDDYYWIYADMDGDGEKWHVATIQIGRSSDCMVLLFPSIDFDDYIENYGSLMVVPILNPEQAAESGEQERQAADRD